jgi:hypothetical protein
MRNHGKSFTTHFLKIEIKADDPAQQDVPFEEAYYPVELDKELSGNALPKQVITCTQGLYGQLFTPDDKFQKNILKSLSALQADINRMQFLHSACDHRDRSFFEAPL